MSLPHSRKRRLILILIIIYYKTAEAIEQSDYTTADLWTGRAAALDLVKPQMEIDEDSWEDANSDIWSAVEDIEVAVAPESLTTEVGVTALFSTLNTALAELE